MPPKTRRGGGKAGKSRASQTRNYTAGASGTTRGRSGRATSTRNHTSGQDRFTVTPSWTELVNNRGGVALDVWLKQNKQRCRDMRLLYVIRANLDRNDGVLKFGRAGGGEDGRAEGRLEGYVHMYGATDGGPSHGVELLYLAGTGTTPGVPWSRSKVYKTEARLRQWAQAGDHLCGRGAERVAGVTPAALVAQIKRLSRAQKDEVQAQRRADRLIRASDRVEAVTAHFRRDNQLTRYLLTWSREAAGNRVTLETKKACERFPGEAGKTALAAIAAYKADRSKRTVWRDE